MRWNKHEPWRRGSARGRRPRHRRLRKAGCKRTWQFTDFGTDCKRFLELLDNVVAPDCTIAAAGARQDGERSAARLSPGDGTQCRVRFLHRYADAVYDTLTDNRTRFVRVEELA